MTFRLITLMEIICPLKHEEIAAIFKWKHFFFFLQIEIKEMNQERKNRLDIT